MAQDEMANAHKAPGGKPNGKGAGKRTKRKKQRSGGARFLLTFLKIVWIPVTCLVVLVIGLYIGYVKIGGQSASEVFQLQTWKHVYDLVFAD